MIYAITVSVDSQTFLFMTQKKNSLSCIIEKCICIVSIDTHIVKQLSRMKILFRKCFIIADISFNVFTAYDDILNMGTFSSPLCSNIIQPQYVQT